MNEQQKVKRFRVNALGELFEAYLAGEDVVRASDYDQLRQRLGEAGELPPLPPVDGYDKRVQGHYSAQQMREYANACRLAGGVTVDDAMVERACKRYAFREDGAEWPDAYSEHEVAAERVLMREFLEHSIGTSKLETAK